MTNPRPNREEEYRRRYNTIVEFRNLTAAAEHLGLPYPTLAKWYHDNRENFPPDIVETIRSNSGRQATSTRPATVRHRLPEDTAGTIRDADRLVDAIFSRLQELKAEVAAKDIRIAELEARLAVYEQQDLELPPFVRLLREVGN